MSEAPVVRGRWIDYSGVYVTQEQWDAHQRRVAEEKHEAQKLADARAEIERLWSQAHPDSPFPYEVYRDD